MKIDLTNDFKDLILKNKGLIGSKIIITDPNSSYYGDIFTVSEKGLNFVCVIEDASHIFKHSQYINVIDTIDTSEMSFTQKSKHNNNNDNDNLIAIDMLKDISKIIECIERDDVRNIKQSLSSLKTNLNYFEFVLDDNLKNRRYD